MGTLTDRLWGVDVCARVTAPPTMYPPAAANATSRLEITQIMPERVIVIASDLPSSSPIAMASYAELEA